MDFRNLAKSCPLCSVLVPRISIPGVFGMNCDEILPFWFLSPVCHLPVADGTAVGVGVPVLMRACDGVVGCWWYV